MLVFGTDAYLKIFVNFLHVDLISHNQAAESTFPSFRQSKSNKIEVLVFESVLIIDFVNNLLIEHRGSLYFFNVVIEIPLVYLFH
jgi:hypothetical protein